MKEQKLFLTNPQNQVGDPNLTECINKESKYEIYFWISILGGRCTLIPLNPLHIFDGLKITLSQDLMLLYIKVASN